MQKTKELLIRAAKRTKRLTILTFKKSMDPYFAGNAAEVAYYLILSLVPALILMAQIFNLFELSMSALIDVLEEYMSPAISTVLTPLLEYSSNTAINLMLIVLVLWAGSKVVFSLMRITNYAYLGGTVDTNPLKWYIRERFRAIITIVLILVTIVFVFNIALYGKTIVTVVEAYMSSIMNWDYELDNIWYYARWVVSFALYFFMVTSIYFLLPSQHNSYKHLRTGKFLESAKKVIRQWLKNCKETYMIIFPGSIFASLGMLLATWIFSFYITFAMTSNFNILYGGLSSIVMLLLWFYLLSYIMILGIQLNSVWNESRFEKSELHDPSGKDI